MTNVMPDFELVVDQIYEAAANPDLWPSVLNDLGGAVNATWGILLTHRYDAWQGGIAEGLTVNQISDRSRVTPGTVRIRSRGSLQKPASAGSPSSPLCLAPCRNFPCGERSA